MRHDSEKISEDEQIVHIGFSTLYQRLVMAFASARETDPRLPEVSTAYPVVRGPG